MSTYYCDNKYKEYTQYNSGINENDVINIATMAMLESSDEEIFFTNISDEIDVANESDCALTDDFFTNRVARTINSSKQTFKTIIDNIVYISDKYTNFIAKDIYNKIIDGIYNEKYYHSLFNNCKNTFHALIHDRRNAEKLFKHLIGMWLFKQTNYELVLL